MLKNILGRKDWRTSPAHLLFLSKFIEPRKPEDFITRTEWQDIANIDFINLHFYVEATESGSKLSVLDDAIDYMEATGKSALINEWGLRIDDSIILENAMDILRNKGLPVAIYFSPYPAAQYAVYELLNNDGTLTNLGQDYRDYLKNHGLR